MFTSISRARFARGGLACLFAVLLSGLLACGSSPEAASGRSSSASLAADETFAAPPFFRVEGPNDARLHLFGTIHLGPAPGWTFSREVETAKRTASAFVLEIDPREATEENVSNAIMRHGVLPAETPLDTVLEPATLRLLEQHEEALAAAGLTPFTRAAMKPWLVAVSLVETTASRAGYRTARSADTAIFDAVGARELVALETLEEQLSFFDSLSPELQDLILRDTLARFDDAAESVEELVQAWRRGDDAALVLLAREGIEDMPDLAPFYDRLLEDRNRAWIAPLSAFLEDPDRARESIFVAVGAFHLVGAEGVPALLEKAGYRVERVHQTQP